MKWCSYVVFSYDEEDFGSQRRPMTTDDVGVSRLGVMENVNYSLSGADWSLEALSLRRRISDLEQVEQHLRRQVLDNYHAMSFANCILTKLLHTRPGYYLDG